MVSNLNEIYSDECENKNDEIELVCQLDDKDKNQIENVNHLEELLRKSRHLNSSKSLRLIDQQIENVSLDDSNRTIENLVLSCNKLGKSNPIDWTRLPNHLRSLELSGNFLNSIDGLETKANQISSLGLSFNELNRIDQLCLPNQWINLCSLDLSYNLLENLKETIDLLKHLNKLRILFLHGNPLSLIVDYRVYVIDSLARLDILDDIRITTEERFRSRHFSKSNQHPKDFAQLKIIFGSIENVPMPISSENEWPIQVHRYKMRLNWFDGESKDIDIPFDKMADFNRFNQSFIQSSLAEYKSTIEFSPLDFDFSIKTLVPFRDFLFHGTNCQFIHQLTEYWPPNEANDQKKKPDSKAEKDKKSESPPKKKKNEDLTKLITRKDPIEEILADFHVDLRPILDGDYHVSSSFQSLLQQQIDSMNQLANQTKSPKKKDKDKHESPTEKKRTSSSKSDKQKQKDKKITDNGSEPIPLPQPFQCSIRFQLQRFVAQQQII